MTFTGGIPWAGFGMLSVALLSTYVVAVLIWAVFTTEGRSAVASHVTRKSICDSADLDRPLHNPLFWAENRTQVYHFR